MSRKGELGWFETLEWGELGSDAGGIARFTMLKGLTGKLLQDFQHSGHE